MKMSCVKKIIAASLAAVISAGLGGCSPKEELVNSAYLTPAQAAPYVESLGNYKGVEVDLTTGDALTMLKNAMSSVKYVKVVDRQVKLGDTVNIEYVGRYEATGEEFAGGSASNVDLTIGSGAFVPGFEEGLIGANALDGTYVHLTFPEDYHSAALAGQKVVFSVFVNYIKEYPAEDVAAAENSVAVAIVAEKAYAETVFRDELPNAFIDAKVNLLIDEVKATANSMGMELELYLNTYYQMSVEDLKADALSYATQNAKMELMYLAIAHKEGISLSDEEYEVELYRMAEEYGYKDNIPGFVEKYGGEDDIRNSILLMKVSDYIASVTVIVK